MFKPKKIVAAFSALLLSAAYAQESPFYTFEPDSLGGSFTWGRDISGNGLVVVGQSATPNGTRAFRWTAIGGIQDLGTIDNGTSSHASATNFDGTVIVGNGKSGLTGFTEAFRWTEATGMQGLGQLNGGNGSEAMDVSDSGDVIAGRAKNGATNRYEAFRWTQTGGMEGLGQLNGGTYSGAHAISGDGMVITGGADNGTTGNTEAFRWTETNGMQGLGELNNGGFSTGYAINSDGSVITGVAENGTTGYWEAFRWTESAGMQGLGYLNGGTYSDARAISADGQIILGDTDLGAFRWTEQTGMISIYDYLTQNGVSLSGWDLSNANSISADGKIMLGAGYNPAGDYLYWIANAKGITDTKEIAYSVNDMYNLSLQTQYIAQSSLANQYFSSEYTCKNLRINQQQNYCTFVSGSFVHDLDNNRYQHQSKAGYGNVGIVTKLKNNTSAGISVNFGQGRHDLRLGGYHDSSSLGISAHIAYGKDTGLSLFAAGSAHSVDIEAKRAYRNGNNINYTNGETKAKAYGALAHVGYQFNLTTKTRLEPFTEVEWTKADLNSFIEKNTGAFPMIFSEQGSAETASRLGINMKYRLSDLFDINASAAWGHQLTHKTDRVLGTLQEANISYASTNSSSNKNWADLSIGASWQAKETLSVQGQVFGSSNSDQTHLGLRIGLSKSF